MAADTSPVLVEVHKFNGRLSARWTAERLGEDEYGVWLGTAEGIPVDTHAGTRPNPYTHVLVIPRGTWWTAQFCAPPGPEVYCDICTVPEWSADGATVRMVDLDLDVVRDAGGRVRLKDAEEFEEHRAEFGYPDALVRTARATTEHVMSAVRAGSEPFAEARRRRLAEFGVAVPR